MILRFEIFGYAKLDVARGLVTRCLADFVTEIKK